MYMNMQSVCERVYEHVHKHQHEHAQCRVWTCTYSTCACTEYTNMYRFMYTKMCMNMYGNYSNIMYTNICMSKKMSKKNNWKLTFYKIRKLFFFFRFVSSCNKCCWFALKRINFCFRYFAHLRCRHFALFRFKAYI